MWHKKVVKAKSSTNANTNVKTSDLSRKGPLPAYGRSVIIPSNGHSLEFLASFLYSGSPGDNRTRNSRAKDHSQRVQLRLWGRRNMSYREKNTQCITPQLPLYTVDILHKTDGKQHVWTCSMFSTQYLDKPWNTVVWLDSGCTACKIWKRNYKAYCFLWPQWCLVEESEVLLVWYIILYIQ